MVKKSPVEVVQPQQKIEKVDDEKLHDKDLLQREVELLRHKLGLLEGKLEELNKE